MTDLLLILLAVFFGAVVLVSALFLFVPALRARVGRERDEPAPHRPEPWSGVNQRETPRGPDA